MAPRITLLDLMSLIGGMKVTLNWKNEQEKDEYWSGIAENLPYRLYRLIYKVVTNITAYGSIQKVGEGEYATAELIITLEADEVKGEAADAV